MENNISRVVYILDTPEGITELRVLADSVEKQGGWVLALWNNKVTGGVKEEHLKAFYLEVN